LAFLLSIPWRVDRGSAANAAGTVDTIELEVDGGGGNMSNLMLMLMLMLSRASRRAAIWVAVLPIRRS
jgi:hypothetical protein